MGWGTRRSVEGGRLEYSRQRLELGSCGAGDQRTGSIQFGAFIGRSGGTGKLEGSPRPPRPLAPSPSLQAFRRSNPIPCDPRPPTSWTVQRLWSVLDIPIIIINNNTFSASRLLWPHALCCTALTQLLYTKHPPDRLPVPARFHVQPRTNNHTPRFTERISSRSRPHTRSPFVQANELPAAPPLFALPPPTIDIFLFFAAFRHTFLNRPAIAFPYAPIHLHRISISSSRTAQPRLPEPSFFPNKARHALPHEFTAGPESKSLPSFLSSRTLGTTPYRQVVCSSSLALFVLFVPFWESRFSIGMSLPSPPRWVFVHNSTLASASPRLTLPDTSMRASNPCPLLIFL